MTAGFLYAVEFSNGVVKIGRGKDAYARIQSHKDRVAVVGLSVVNTMVIACDDARQAEMHALSKAKSLPGVSWNGKEWFNGISFSDACLCIEFGSSQVVEPAPVLRMEAIDKAGKVFGGQSAMAEKLGASKQKFWSCLNRPSSDGMSIDTSDITELRNTVVRLNYSKLEKISGIHRNTISRFAMGGDIKTSTLEAIEKAVDVLKAATAPAERQAPAGAVEEVTR